MIIDGRVIAKSMGEDLREKIAKLGKKITLAVFFVGDDPGSISFIAQKEKFGNAIGIDVRVVRSEADISVGELKQKISSVAGEDQVKGIIVQLPLPSNFSKEQTQEILDVIPSQKDPDFLTSQSLGRFYTGVSNALPPTVAAFAKAMEQEKILFKKGAVATLVGQGALIGKPLAVYLTRQGMTVFACNKSTKNISKLTKASDLVISGTGAPKLIKGRMIKKGAVVIDFGFSLKGNKIAGDVDAERVSKIAKYVSAVPGGMGPITVAMLFKNLVDPVRKLL